jgi:hypothetical protein
MENYTLTYSEAAQGFPSFYSYFPEIIKGMNQFLYTFQGGNLYKHNTNETRNNFYGIQGISELTSIFNESPLENKKFKTIALESDDPWQGTFITDIQTTGFINADLSNPSNQYYEKKENDWFAYIRNSGNVPANLDQYALRSLTGIGNSTSFFIDGAITTILFEPPVNIGSMLSIGDAFYFGVANASGDLEPTLAGIVQTVSFSNIGNVLVELDNTVAGVVPIPSQTEYFLYIKNSIAESQGVMGHYCEFTLSNASTSATELFAVKSEAFKSFP